MKPRRRVRNHGRVALTTGTAYASHALWVSVACVAIQWLLAATWPGSALLLHALLMSCVILAMAFLGDEDGRFDLRQPWLVLLVFHIPFWVVGTVYSVIGDDSALGWDFGAESLLTKAMLVVSVGFLLIGLGYRCGLKIHFRSPSFPLLLGEWHLNRLFIIAIPVYGAIWYTRFLWYQNYLQKPYFEVLTMGPPPPFIRMGGTILPAFLLATTWMAYYANPRAKRLLLLGWALTLGEVTWGFAYGVMKSVLFLPLFVPVIPYIILRGKLPVVRLALTAAVLLLVAYPYVNTVRLEYFQTNGPPRPVAIRAALDRGWELFSFRKEKLSHYATQAAERVSGIGAVGEVLRLGQEGALDINGEFYWRALVALVPRTLWKEKPIIHEGVYFSAYLDGQRGIKNIDTSAVSGSVALTLFGSFYWNLKWPGVLLSSFFLGLFSGIAYHFLRTQGLATRPATFLYYGAVLSVLDTTETEVVRLLANLIMGLMLAWGANWFLGMGAPDGRRERIVRGRRHAARMRSDSPAANTTEGSQAALSD